MLRVGATLQYDQIYASVNYAYISQQFSDATNAVETTNAIYGLIPAYWVTDVSCGIQVKQVKLSLHVNNLTNNFYFTRSPQGYGLPGAGHYSFRSQDLLFECGHQLVTRQWLYFILTRIP
jgi:Fe(3+) dicitrate transport protein